MCKEGRLRCCCSVLEDDCFFLETEREEAEEEATTTDPPSRSTMHHKLMDKEDKKEGRTNGDMIWADPRENPISAGRRVDAVDAATSTTAAAGIRGRPEIICSHKYESLELPIRGVSKVHEEEEDAETRPARQPTEGSNQWRVLCHVKSALYSSG